MRHAIFAIALVLILLVCAHANTQVTTSNSAITTTTTSTGTNPARRTGNKPSLVVLSTLDGAVIGLDAATGREVFAVRSETPALSSWARDGHPEYVPTLDGELYELDPNSGEARPVNARFISRASPSGEASVLESASGNPRNGAVVLTAQSTVALSVSLRTGAVVQALTLEGTNSPVSDEAYPSGAIPGDDIVLLLRSQIGIRVVDPSTRIELANATLTQTQPSFLESGRCLEPVTNQGDLEYTALISKDRGTITLTDASGAVVWSRDVDSAVVDVHGMGAVGVSVDSDDLGRHRALGAGHAQLPFVASKALPPGTARTARIVVSSHEKGKYARIGYNQQHSKDDELAVYVVKDDPNISPIHSDKVSATSSQGVAALFMFAVVVCLMTGYTVGRRWKRWTRIWRSVVFEEPSSGPAPYLSFDFEEGAELVRKLNEAEGEEATRRRRVVRRKRPKPSDSRRNGEERENDEVGKTLEDEHGEERVESTESTGSRSSGGVISNRTEEGWLNVGGLEVSQNVLGYGSHGTIVFEGRMVQGGRKVAVKRLLRQFYESAKKEITLLVQLDELSSHVVRVFDMEEDSEFIYLALELCSGNLADRVTKKKEPALSEAYQKGPIPLCTLKALRHLIQGLEKLHGVDVVHRDLKPQNVLISRVQGNKAGEVKLADVGLATKLDPNRSSYTAITNNNGGVGTTGWRAPEVLRAERQTKSVDIFSAGCVMFFVLTGGKHPFGEYSAVRDGNILDNKCDLSPLEQLELPEAVDIVRKMIDPISNKRPTAEVALSHPFFWSDATKLSFLIDISDRLYDLRNDPARYTEKFDRYHMSVKYCSDWRVHIDMALISELGRGYDNTASGILRVIRNKRNHYSELSDYIHQLLGPLPEDDSNGDQVDSHARNFLTYFTSRVPNLFMTTYTFALLNDALTQQPHFTRYGIKGCITSPNLHPMVARRQLPEAAPPTNTPNGKNQTRRKYSLVDIRTLQRAEHCVDVVTKDRLTTHGLYDPDVGRRRAIFFTTGVREPAPRPAHEGDYVCSEDDEPPPAGFERPPRFINSASPAVRPRRPNSRFASPAQRAYPGPRGPHGEGFTTRDRSPDIPPGFDPSPPEPLELKEPDYKIDSVTKRRERMQRAKELQAKERRNSDRDWGVVRRQ